MDNVDELLHNRQFLPAGSIATMLERQWAKSHKMTLLQLLDTLRNALATEEHILRFDYFSAHERCMRVLHALQTSLDDKLRQYFGAAYIEKDTQLPFIVGYIFYLAVGTEKFEESMKSKGIIKSKILKEAGVIVDGFIKREGRVECDKLEKTCVWRSRTQASDSKEVMGLSPLLENVSVG